MNEGFVDHNADSPLIQEQDLLMVCEGNEVEEDDDDNQHVGLVTMLHTQNASVAAGSINVVDVSPVAEISGIPGWDMVGQLEQMLMKLKGIAVLASQADRLKALYDAPHDYDKRKVKAHLKAMPQLCGCFCQQKKSRVAIKKVSNTFKGARVKFYMLNVKGPSFLGIFHHLA